MTSPGCDSVPSMPVSANSAPPFWEDSIATEPLMENRLQHAGGVFGGAALAAGLAGLIIWTRLVRAKKKFDHAAAVEAALEEVDWGTLEASIKKHTGKEGAGTTA